MWQFIQLKIPSPNRVMKYAGKYYPFSFVRAASSPHPRTHTDARHLWMILISLSPAGEVTYRAWHGLPRAAETAATASNPWPLRVDSHAPSSTGRARWRDLWTCGGGRGALARRDTGQTLSDIGRERAAGRAPASTAPHARARTRDDTSR